MSTMTGTPLPSAPAVRELFEGLLGREVEATIGTGAVNPGTAPGAVVGVYTDDRMALRAIVLLELSLAAHAGAAIALIPVVQAEVAADDGVLPDTLYENVAEVLNVAASVFNADDAPHVKLYQSYRPGEQLPADVSKWVLAFVRRVDMELSISGYGKGRVSVLVL
ncbi:hypothetical protein Q6348_02645 [Isoptericola sp. b441]|uniref:Uncharacterized protein n=1 Tax=Actinotalea lenta TaxID=3064654 RepID=A0ABT9DAX4_9CELL|nr:MULTISPECIES: hypothetical protein [unclassified Isoptericola]MDO8106092.1 hypothetical protein [Isoptericola sp. b441]MDO8122189.1 hypothetical protein [Isoptericola sp. b490]